MKLPQPLQSPLSRRMLAWTLSTVVVMTLAESAVQLKFGYNEDVSGIRQNIRQTLRYHLPSISHSLYRLDEEQLRNEMSALLQDPNIASLVVWGTSSPRTLKVEVGSRRLPHSIRLSYRLIHRLPAGQPLPVGYLQVTVDLSKAWSRLWNNGVINLVSNGLTILAVSLAILLLLHIGIARHLHIMAKHAAAIDLNHLDRTLKLKRLFRRQRPDEIDQVAGALNDLQLRLKEDIEQRTRMERRLQQSQKLESLGTLAGGVAHDINNVLGIILGQTELALAALPKDSPVRERLELSLQGVDRAKDIVHQVLAFSRRTEVRRRPIDISKTVKEALTLMRATIPKTVELKTEISPHCGYVIADPTEIQQVLMNLCSNGAQAMEETGGSLFTQLQTVILDANDVLAKVGAPEGKYALLTVRDTGHGMDKQTQEHIFEPYFTTKDIGKGTGLGLSVVHGIVTGLNGSITVHSALGAGATFRVFLPCAIEEEDLDDPNEFASDVLPGGTERILVVDDEELLVNTTGDSLEKLGYTVSRFTDPLEALNALRSEPSAFDCLITDLTMPKLTGAELALEARGIRKDLPILLCTGFSERVDSLKVREMGKTDLVMKPLLRIELAKTLRRIIDTPI